MAVGLLQELSTAKTCWLIEAPCDLAFRDRDMGHLTGFKLHEGHGTFQVVMFGSYAKEVQVQHRYGISFHFSPSKQPYIQTSGVADGHGLKCQNHIFGTQCLNVYVIGPSRSCCSFKLRKLSGAAKVCCADFAVGKLGLSWVKI